MHKSIRVLLSGVLFHEALYAAMQLRHAYSTGRKLAELCTMQDNHDDTVSVELIIICTSISISRACEANII